MNTKYSNIRVRVARSQDAANNGSCDDVRACDTIAEAKKFARYALTEGYRDSHETSELMNYAAVMADEDGREVCVADYFRKGYVCPAEQMADDASGPDDSDVVSLAYQPDMRDPMGLGGI